MLKAKKVNPLRVTANRLADTKHESKTENLIVNNRDTNIPNNVPIAIIGEKGSGKTTLLNALIETLHEPNNHLGFVSVFYIYTSLSLDVELPEYVVRINVNQAESFLAQFFEVKSIFNSYLKFFEKVNKSKILKEDNEKNLKEFLSVCDNDIIKYNDEVVNSGSNIHVIIDKIIETGEKILSKFSKPFFIDSIKVPGIRKQQRDAIVVDDIAIAAPLLFKNKKSNSIYEYLTLSRHMKTLIVFSGQQLDQLPKPIRREIMCWIVSKNTTLELLNGIVQKAKVDQIQELQKNLQKYEFVIYNAVSGVIGVL